MHAVQQSHWLMYSLIAALVVSVFLAMGYGLIGFIFIFVVGGLLGGAVASYLH